MRANVRDGETLPQQSDFVLCSRYRERGLEELVPSLLCFRAEGGEEAHARGTGAVSFMLSRRGRGRGSRRQSRRGASEETVTPEINSESCNSRYHGE
jgi:hypothetical protein